MSTQMKFKALALGLLLSFPLINASDVAPAAVVGASVLEKGKDVAAAAPAVIAGAAAGSALEKGKDVAVAGAGLKKPAADAAKGKFAKAIDYLKSTRPVAHVLNASRQRQAVYAVATVALVYAAHRFNESRRTKFRTFGFLGYTVTLRK